jgi:hypothetical protein
MGRCGVASRAHRVRRGLLAAHSRAANAVVRLAATARDSQLSPEIVLLLALLVVLLIFPN